MTDDYVDLTLHGYDQTAGRPTELRFIGRPIGEATSRAPRHSRLVHEVDSFAPPGVRCSACRWFEVRIYDVREVLQSSSNDVTDRTGSTNRTRAVQAISRLSGVRSRDDGPERAVPDAPTWVIATVGGTVVPGETPRYQLWKASEPRLVVAALVQTKGRVSSSGPVDDDVFIPATSRRALDQAADNDERLAGIIDELLVFD